jgi:pyroglutamyl-peptidase
VKTVLLTGFEPFGGEVINPSALAVEELDGRTIARRRVVSAVLPCVFGESIVALKRELRRVRPELVVCVGQAGGRAGISVERIAINVDDARIPDNLGEQPIDEPIARRGPAAYWSTLPIKAVVGALNEAGIEAAVSQSAGTFVCNHVFYGLMRTLKRRQGVRGGFIHVPYTPAQAQAQHGGRPVPSMSLEEIVRGLEIATRTALTTRRDRRVTGGATH